MNIERVKNMIIVFLLVINSVFCVLLIINSGKYKLPSQQEKAIRSLLEENNISVSTPLVKTYKPARALTVDPYNYDLEIEIPRFFGKTGSLERNDSWNRISIENDVGVLSLEEGVLRFELKSGYKTEEFTQKGYNDQTAVRKLCDDYLKQIKPEALEFRLEHIDTANPDYMIYDYRGYYNGSWIYSNSIRLRVDKSGILVARCFYSGIPSGFDSYARDIYAPDEALFSLMKQLKIESGDIAADITGMKMVYNLESAATDITKAALCYKFDVSVRYSQGSYLVDAYTNSIIR